MTTGPSALDREALRSFVGECVEYFEFGNGVTVPVHAVREFKMLFSICAEVIRLAQGYEALRQVGLRVEGRLLVRSALEYAVTAQYCYLTVGGLDRLYVSVNEGRRKLFENLANLTKNDEFRKMRDDIAAPSPADSRLGPVQNLMDVLDPDGVIFRQAYQILSQSTHVTTTSLTEHLRVDPKDRRIISIANNDDRDRLERESLYALALACMAATWIVAHIRGDEEMLGQLDTRSEALRLGGTTAAGRRTCEHARIE